VPASRAEPEAIELVDLVAQIAGRKVRVSHHRAQAFVAEQFRNRA
jgi:hypothetical protein